MNPENTPYGAGFSLFVLITSLGLASLVNTLPL